MQLAHGRTIGAPCGVLTCQNQRWDQLPLPPGTEPVLSKDRKPAAFSPLRDGTDAKSRGPQPLGWHLA